MFNVGDAVEVLRPNENEWIGGKVMERRIRDDGTVIFFVQLAGRATTAFNDPSIWFTDKQMRPSKA